MVELDVPDNMHVWFSGRAQVIKATRLEDDGVRVIDGITLSCGCCEPPCYQFLPAPFALYLAKCIKEAAEHLHWTMTDDWVLSDDEEPWADEGPGC